jgi:hypothetical protein
VRGLKGGDGLKRIADTGGIYIFVYLLYMCRSLENVGNSGVFNRACHIIGVVEMEGGRKTMSMSFAGV